MIRPTRALLPVIVLALVAACGGGGSSADVRDAGPDSDAITVTDVSFDDVPGDTAQPEAEAHAEPPAPSDAEGPDVPTETTTEATAEPDAEVVEAIDIAEPPAPSDAEGTDVTPNAPDPAEPPPEVVDAFDGEGQTPPDVTPEPGPEVEEIDDVTEAVDVAEPPAPSDVEGDVPPAPRVTVNEVVAKAAASGPDWVELFNAGDAAADLSGVTLRDDDDAHVYELPAGTTLEPGAFLVLEGSGGTGPWVFEFGLGKADAVRLFDADGAPLDDTAWLDGDAPEGASWGRYPDGTGVFDTLPTPTPGAPNVPGSTQPPVDLSLPVFDPQRVMQVDLALPQASVDALFVDPRTYVPATVTLKLEDYKPVTLEVGVRIKGKWGSFRDLNGKAALKVKLDYSVDNQAWRGLSSLTLNNMVQDASMIREAVAYRVFRELDVPAARTGYAWVRVNGLEYGFYSVIETYDREMIERWFPATQHVYEGEYGTDLAPGAAAVFDIDQGPDDDLTDLQALIAVANEPDDEAWQAGIDAATDFDELLTMWAVEQYIGHWDGYSTIVVNNYYLHSDPAGRFSMLPWGTDQTFQDFRDVHSGNGLLFRRCLALPGCRARFDQALAAVLAKVDTLDLDAFAVQLEAHVAPWAEIDPRKESTLDDLHGQVQSTRDFLVNRRAAIGDLVACLLDPATDLDGDGHKCDGDCVEGDASIYPGAHDDCGDGVDQDCSGRADDALECPDCVEHWFGPHRYQLCPNERTWQEARQHCQDFGADLVIVDDDTENARLYALLQTTGLFDQAWLGLTDVDVEGQFTWFDGSPLAVFGWSWGEPNDSGGEDCTQIYAWGGWNDLACDARQPVLCEDACAPGQDDDADGFPRCGADCDDANDAIHPGAVEFCNDGFDNDCDGYVDNGPDCLPSTPLAPNPPTPGAAFFLLNDPLDREAARAVCVAAGVGADLAWLTSPAEAFALHGAVQAVAQDTEVWIGLNDQMQEDLYLWPDGTVTLFTTWADAQPNNGSGTGEQDCVRVLADGRWDDADCALPLRAICRVPQP